MNRLPITAVNTSTLVPSGVLTSALCGNCNARVQATLEALPTLAHRAEIKDPALKRNALRQEKIVEEIEVITGL